jgi:hypothetical protein
MGEHSSAVLGPRIFFGIAAIVALVLVASAVASAASGGCQLVFSLGPVAALGPAAGAAPQVGPAVPGGPSNCQAYVDLQTLVLEVVLGALLLLTALYLGRAPSAWGRILAVGAAAGLIAAFAASFAIVQMASSDQPQANPRIAILLIAALPPIAALASIAVLWRTARRGRDGMTRPT